MDMQHRRIVYLDSKRTPGTESFSNTLLEYLRNWLKDVVTDQYSKERAMSLELCEWKTVVNPPYIPEQLDGNSCGIFLLALVDYLELGKCPDFTQADVPVLRKRAAIALRRGALPKN